MYVGVHLQVDVHGVACFLHAHVYMCACIYVYTIYMYQVQQK